MFLIDLLSIAKKKRKQIGSFIDEICNYQPKTGMCKAYFTRWYFNPNIQACETFIYGGCGADYTSNNFRTRESCEAYCLGNAGFQSTKYYVNDPYGDDTIILA